MEAKHRAAALTFWYVFFLGVLWLACVFSARVIVFAVAILTTLFLAGSLFMPLPPEEKRISGWPLYVSFALNASIWTWAFSMLRPLGIIVCAFTTFVLIFTIRELWMNVALERLLKDRRS